jgi:hypothetical protein
MRSWENNNRRVPDESDAFGAGHAAVLDCLAIPCTLIFPNVPSVDLIGHGGARARQGGWARGATVHWESLGSLTSPQVALKPPACR